jgi:hypothetical protein
VLGDLPTEECAADLLASVSDSSDDILDLAGIAPVITTSRKKSGRAPYTTMSSTFIATRSSPMVS